MTAKALMIQGTGSDVGKSIIVAGLCRVAKNRGIKVAPFKPQNMSNNAAACADGGEIGRAQALQAMASGVAPQVDHNPVLLKPETDRIAQVVVQGKVHSTMQAASFISSRDSLLPPVLASFDRLSAENQLLLVEGAGSPAETNLRARDIANMGFARAANVPVCLLGDIERGGVIASIVGTKTVIDAQDAAMITGFVINKFRGDPSLFDDGVVEIEERTGWPCFGVIPWITATTRLPAEDAVAQLRYESGVDRPIRIAAPMLSRMANFDDADPLRLEPGVQFDFVPPGQPIPRDIDLIILFGSKSTIGDLHFLREQGWDHDIIAHARSGGRVLGICGGYQMLGHAIVDSAGNDGNSGQVNGLGLLEVVTRMECNKTVRPVGATCVDSGEHVAGYEIHVGETTGSDRARPMFQVSGRDEGARSADGRVSGTYVHGLMQNNAYRRAFLATLGQATSEFDYGASVEDALNELASELENSLDIDRLFACSRPTSSR
ncbi:MAG: cobyric acid synthase [Woeseiaceae bacterium]